MRQALLALLVICSQLLVSARASEVPPSAPMSREEVRLLHLAIQDLGASELGPDDRGVPTAFPNDVVRYIVRYRSAAAPVLLEELGLASSNLTTGYICFCLSLVTIPPGEVTRYQVALGRLHDRLHDADRAAPGDRARVFALRCCGQALDALDHAVAASPASSP